MLLTANAETGTNGATPTAGTDFDIVTIGSGGTIAYSQANHIDGTTSYGYNTGSTATYTAWSTSLGGTKSELWLRTYVMVPTLFTGPIIQLRYNSGLAGRISLNNTGFVQLLSGAGSVIGTSGTAITAGVPFRIELHAIASASPTGGTLELRVYNSMDNGTPTSTVGPFATTQTAAGFDQVWFGPSAGAAGSVMYQDNVAASDTGWLGPANTPTTAPTWSKAPSAPTGTTYEGETLEVSSVGTWAGTPYPTFTYQWRRCDASGNNAVAISGATDVLYTLTAADIGSTIRVAVTGTNVSGSSTVASPQTAIVTSQPITSPAQLNSANGTNGVAASAGNSGGTAGTAFDIITITAGGSISYDTSQKVEGTASLHVVSAGVSAFVGWSAAVLGTLPELYGRFYIKIPAYPSNGGSIARISNNGTTQVSFNITNTGLIRIRNAAGNALASGNAKIPLNTWVRFEFRVLADISNGIAESRLYVDKDSTLPSESLIATALPIDASVDQATFGLITNATAGDVLWIDELATDSGWIGPVAVAAKRWGWGTISPPGAKVYGQPTIRKSSDIIWGVNLYNSYDPYFGTTETAQNVIDRTTATFGKIGMCKTFYNKLSTFSYALEGATPGKRAIICTKYDQIGLANGDFDTDIRTYVRSIPAGWYIILVNWQEPDFEMLKAPIQFTPAQHVAASNHMASIVHDEIANNRLASGALCEVWDCFENFTVTTGYGGQKWDDSFAALQTDGIGWDVYGNPPPGARTNKTAGNRSPISGSNYGLGGVVYDPSVYINGIRTISTRLGFAKWGIMEFGAPFRQGDIQSVTGKPDGFNRGQWYARFCDSVIESSAMLALVFDAEGTNFDQRLINYPESSFIGSRSLLPGVSWNPSPRPSSGEEPTVTILHSYFSQGK
jgi:hypothetical protein